MGGMKEIMSWCLNLKNKSHPVKDAHARTLGVSVMKNSDRGEAFAPFYARMPSVLVESADPFFEKGSRSAFFWYLFFAEAKKSTQELLPFAIFPLQKQRKVERTEARNTNHLNLQKYTPKTPKLLDK